MEEVFRKADISEGINVDGENLINFRFADDVDLFDGKKSTKQIEKHLNSLNSECLKVGLKVHKGKTKYITNHADSEHILMDQENIEERQNSNTSGKPQISKTLPMKKMLCQEQNSVELFWK